MTAHDGRKQEMALVQKVRVHLDHAHVIRLVTLVIQGLGRVLRKAEEIVIEEFGDSLVNDRSRHSSICIIEHHELPNIDIVAKHDVATAIVVMSALNKAFRHGLIRFLTLLLSAKHKTEMRVDIRGLLELSTAVNSRTSDPTNLVTVVKQHAVEHLDNTLTVKSFEMETRHTRNSLEKEINVGNASLCLFHIVPKHLSCSKVVLQVRHDTIVTNNNVALGSGLLLVVITGNHAALERGPKNLLKTLLIDRNLNGDINPFVIRMFLFRNAGKVLLVGFEGLGRNEALKDTGCCEVSIPEDTKEGNNGKNALHNGLSDRGVLPVY